MTALERLRGFVALCAKHHAADHCAITLSFVEAAEVLEELDRHVAAVDEQQGRVAEYRGRIGQATAILTGRSTP